MQYEHQHYAEVRSLKKLGHIEKNDDAQNKIDEEREAREKHRSDLKQELVNLQKEKVWDLQREAQLKDELDLMHEQDEQKLA